MYFFRHFHFACFTRLYCQQLPRIYWHYITFSVYTYFISEVRYFICSQLLQFFFDISETAISYFHISHHLLDYFHSLYIEFLSLFYSLSVSIHHSSSLITLYIFWHYQLSQIFFTFHDHDAYLIHIYISRHFISMPFSIISFDDMILPCWWFQLPRQSTAYIATIRYFIEIATLTLRCRLFISLMPRHYAAHLIYFCTPHYFQASLYYISAIDADIDIYIDSQILQPALRHIYTRQLSDISYAFAISFT